MAIPVIDFSKLNGEERAKTMAEIANGCKEWGFFQLVNHGISVELLERVKKVCSECYKLEREEDFKNSAMVKKLNDLAEKKDSKKLENVDWEDVFLLSEENEWPSKTPGFKKTMEEYRSELKKLAEKVMEVMDENLGLPKEYIKKAFNGGCGENAFFGTKVFELTLTLEASSYSSKTTRSEAFRSTKMENGSMSNHCPMLLSSILVTKLRS
ncbi:hypothetical protein CsSME_00035020 [Camellia sinensis var. sinensis]